jgi:hypothetical protein
MAEKGKEELQQKRATAAGVRLRPFKAPDTMPAEFGMQTEAEDHISGVVATDQVRNLLDAFGLHERANVVFPFQHMKKQHGEVWSMRIEPLAAHTVEGKPVMAHQWTYMRQQPESVGAAA